jgi:hypothetical protein
MMNFGEILGKAWKILWKHKVLWIFGILAGLVSGNGGGGSNGGGSSNSGTSAGDWDWQGGAMPSWMQGWQDTAERMWQAVQPYLWIIIVVAVLLILIFIVLGVIGKVGLLRGAKKADEDMDVRLTFGGLLTESVPYFWRMLGFTLLLMVGVIILAVLLVLAVAGLVIGTLGIGLLLLIPLLCLLVPVAMLFQVYLEQAQIALVVEDLGIIDAFKRGWRVFRGRLGEMIVMGLILGIGGWLVALLIFMPILVILTPAIITLVVNGGELTQTITVGTLIAVGIYGLLAIFLRGLLTTYVESAWVLTFRRAAAALVPAAMVILPEEPEAPVQTA